MTTTKLASLLVLEAFLKGIAVQTFWNWFVASTFPSAPSLSLISALGVSLLARAIVPHTAPRPLRVDEEATRIAFYNLYVEFVRLTICFIVGGRPPPTLARRLPMITIGNQSRGDTGLYIGRPSIHGNPYKIGRDGDRTEVLTKYRSYLFEECLDSSSKLRKSIEDLERVTRDEDITLVCWCSPEACHGDILKYVLELIPEIGWAGVLRREAEQRGVQADIWTEAYRPWMLGGNPNAPVMTRVPCLGPYDLGKGYRGVVAVAPNGRTFVAESTSGGIVGSTLISVREDIRIGTDQVMFGQVEEAKKRSLQCDRISEDQFWSLLRCNSGR